jgi:excisionase family DNA binding protein
LSEPLALPLPAELVEAIAQRAAALVLEHLELIDDWLDAAAAADYLAVSVGQVRNLVSEGRLPRHGPKGHRLRFRRSELDAYQEGCRRGTRGVR